MIFQKIFLVFSPLIIYLYLINISVDHQSEVSINDPLNKLIYSLPICGWNLSHVFLFYLVSTFLEPLFKNKLIAHLCIFLIGISWYFIERILFFKQAQLQNLHDNPKYVYLNVFVPRLDDLIFNLLGQILYMSYQYIIYFQNYE